jgi:hypothetical protein
MHPLRKLRETGPSTLARLEAILADNAVYYSPVLLRSTAWTMEPHS